MQKQHLPIVQFSHFPWNEISLFLCRLILICSRVSTRWVLPFPNISTSNSLSNICSAIQTRVAARRSQLLHTQSPSPHVVARHQNTLKLHTRPFSTGATASSRFTNCWQTSKATSEYRYPALMKYSSQNEKPDPHISEIRLVSNAVCSFQYVKVARWNKLTDFFTKWLRDYDGAGRVYNSGGGIE